MGGDAALPSEIAWPEDKNGHPMLHLMALPSRWANQYAGCRLPYNYCVSIFIPFQKNSITHVIDLARNPLAAYVIAHEAASTLRQECASPLIPPHGIRIECDPDRPEEDEFGEDIEDKIGGGATWLQDRITAEGKQFLLQIGGMTFDTYWPTHGGMFMGGMLYLFIADAIALDGRCGQLTVQYT